MAGDEASKDHAKRSHRSPRQQWQTRLAAVLIIAVSLPLLASGLRFLAIEIEAFGAQQAAKKTFVGRTLEEDEEALVRTQLVEAAKARPTRARMEWASDAYARAGRDMTQGEEAAAMAFLQAQLALNPASHPAWARLTWLQYKSFDRRISAQTYKMAYETGAYMPSSAIWAIVMGQRNWIYLKEVDQQAVQKLTFDVFSFAPAATATVAKPEWRRLFIRAALAHEPEKLKLFERYLTLYFDPAYNR